jgi:hypothetical protein
MPGLYTSIPKIYGTPNVLANEAAALELFNSLVMSSADFDKPAFPYNWS